MLTKNEKGFTLIELLVVLSILTILLLIGNSLQIKTLEHNQMKQFYQSFQSDLLYMQQYTIVMKENIQLFIKPDSHYYEIRKRGTGKLLIRRTIPTNWNVKLNTLTMPLSFSLNGTIKNPGTLIVETKQQTYTIIFPFGKGRSYMIETQP